MKKKLFFIAMVLGTACAAGVYYYFFAPGGNGFLRNWKRVEIAVETVRPLEENSYLAFVTSQEIWLNKRKNPLELLRLNKNLTQLKRVKLPMPPGFDATLHNYYFSRFADGLMIGNEHKQLARVGSDTVSYHASGLVFDEFEAVSGKSVVVRSFRKEGLQRYLELVKLHLSDSIKMISSFRIPKQVDGVFCADGSLQFDPATGCFFYLFYRRGAFVCLDSNLKVLYHSKTIDTVSKAQVKYVTYTKRLKNGKLIPKRTLSTPGHLVNKCFTLNGNNLYILSGLRADNQSFGKFADYSTIDVYRAENGTYLYSFMIPRYKGLLLRQFHIQAASLIAVYDKYLVSYRIKPVP